MNASDAAQLLTIRMDGRGLNDDLAWNQNQSNKQSRIKHRMHMQEKGINDG